MNVAQLSLQIIIFCYMLWLGLYLLARNPRTRLLLFAGIGTIIYALMLGFDLIYQAGAAGGLLVAISWPLPLLLRSHSIKRDKNSCW